jgi:hypothetical protein
VPRIYCHGKRFSKDLEIDIEYAIILGIYKYMHPNYLLAFPDFPVDLPKDFAAPAGGAWDAGESNFPTPFPPFHRGSSQLLTEFGRIPPLKAVIINLAASS